MRLHRCRSRNNKTAHVLSEELSQFSTRDFASVGVSCAGMLATRSLCSQLGREGVVELAASHALLVLLLRDFHFESEYTKRA